MNGAILQFTGLSGAGKTTLARVIRDRLVAVRAVEILDGDVVRTHLSKGLGFGRADRETNVRRIGFVARLLAKHGVFVIQANISPYADVRNEMRRLAEAEGIGVVDVFVDARLESLIARDVKGLYKRALAGEIPHFTGVSDPYEPPDNPDVRVRTDEESVDTSVARIWRALIERGLAGPS